jgi:hypothetical protein
MDPNARLDQEEITVIGSWRKAKYEYPPILKGLDVGVLAIETSGSPHD